MKTISTLIVCAALLVSPARCFAWGEVGHRIVARIAASQLTPTARANVARILGVAHHAVGQIVDLTLIALHKAVIRSRVSPQRTLNQCRVGLFHYQQGSPVLLVSARL